MNMKQERVADEQMTVRMKKGTRARIEHKARAQSIKPTDFIRRAIEVAIGEHDPAQAMVGDTHQALSRLHFLHAEEEKELAKLRQSTTDVQDALTAKAMKGDHTYQHSESSAPLRQKEGAILEDLKT